MRESSGLPALGYPLPAAERVAVVGARLRAEPGVRSFPHWSTSNLEAWKPQALAGPRSELFAMGALRRQGYLALPDLRFPLVVLSSLPEGPLSAEQHERLWFLFELPVYEQIRSTDETLLGWECDARDGWHLACDEHGAPKLTLAELRAAGWRGAQLRSFCGCGQPCHRLVVEPLLPLRARAAVAGHSAHDGNSLLYAS
jgi:hypothetical protein